MINRVKRFATHFLILLIMLIPIHAYGESRNVYIGDNITIDIKKDYSSIDEIRDGLKEHEIVDIVEVNDNYRVTFKLFNLGKNTLSISGTNITINVASTLDDIKREDIFEGNIIPKGTSKVYPYKMLYMMVIFCTMIVVSILVIAHCKKKNIKKPLPYDIFKVSVGEIAVDSDKALVEMTSSLKKLIEELYGHRVMGKTTKEIMQSISKIQELDGIKSDIKSWLDNCDRYKYSEICIDFIETESMKESILEIGLKIDSTKEVSV